MAATWTAESLNVTKTIGSLSDVANAVNFYVYDSETVGSGESAVTYQGQYGGTVSLSAPDASSFTAYSDITSSTALTWARNALGTDEIASIESSIANQIETQKNPPNYTGIPWS